MQAISFASLNEVKEIKCHSISVSFANKSIIRHHDNMSVKLTAMVLPSNIINVGAVALSLKNQNQERLTRRLNSFALLTGRHYVPPFSLKLGMGDNYVELTKSILKEIENGKDRFEPDDKSLEALQKFQAIANRIKSAYDKNLIREAHFLTSKRRQTIGMYTVILIVGRLTFEGEQYLNCKHTEHIGNKMTNQTININSAQAVQIGNQNSQQITITIQSLVEKIDSSSGSESEKIEAKKLLNKFLNN